MKAKHKAVPLPSLVRLFAAQKEKTPSALTKDEWRQLALLGARRLDRLGDPIREIEPKKRGRPPKTELLPTSSSLLDILRGTHRPLEPKKKSRGRPLKNDRYYVPVEYLSEALSRIETHYAKVPKKLLLSAGLPTTKIGRIEWVLCWVRSGVTARLSTIHKPSSVRFDVIARTKIGRNSLSVVSLFSPPKCVVGFDQHIGGTCPLTSCLTARG